MKVIYLIIFGSLLVSSLVFDNAFVSPPPREPGEGCGIIPHEQFYNQQDFEMLIMTRAV